MRGEDIFRHRLIRSFSQVLGVLVLLPGLSCSSYFAVDWQDLGTLSLWQRDRVGCY
jgi:hypothetical protein